MAERHDAEHYGQSGQKLSFGPPVHGDGSTASQQEQRGQTGSSSAQQDGRIPPTGGSSTAPPKTQK
jgi:hypothetical protein